MYPHDVSPGALDRGTPDTRLAYPKVTSPKMAQSMKAQSVSMSGESRYCLRISVSLVNYAHPKGCELVMLPMLPWQAYSTIGWLTDTLPSRFSEYRLAAS